MALFCRPRSWIGILFGGLVLSGCGAWCRSTPGQPIPVTDAGPLPRHDVENEHVVGLLDHSNFRLVGRSNPDGPYILSARNWTDLYGYAYDGDDPQFIGRRFAYVSTGGYERRGNFTQLHRGGVAIFDVTHDGDPEYYGTFQPECSAAQCNFLIRDIEIQDGIAYFSSDRGALNNGGVFVADLRSDPIHPTQLAHLNSANFDGLNAVHEIGLDVVAPGEAYLYTNDSNVNGRISIYDVGDPRGRGVQRVADINSVSTHGVYADDGVLYVAGTDTVTVFDVTQIGTGNFTQIGQFPTPGGFTHSSWPDEYVNDAGETRNVIYLAHEANGTDLQVWDVTDVLSGIDPAGAFQIANVTNLQLELTQGTGQITNVHNLFLVNDLLFTSWTVGGMVVLDVSHPASPHVVDTFDTTNVETISNFAGAFGVSPVLGLDRVLISDRANGLWVVDVSGVVPEPSALTMGGLLLLVMVALIRK